MVKEKIIRLLKQGRCPTCDGRGYTIIFFSHECNGDPDVCISYCPGEEREECQWCAESKEIIKMLRKKNRHIVEVELLKCLRDTREVLRHNLEVHHRKDEVMMLGAFDEIDRVVKATRKK